MTIFFSPFHSQSLCHSSNLEIKMTTLKLKCNSFHLTKPINIVIKLTIFFYFHSQSLYHFPNLEIKM